MTVHKCVRCGKVYPPTSGELLAGCSCGSRVFAFVKGDSAIELLKQVKPGQMDWLEKELDAASLKESAPASFEDGEGIRVISKGCYAINVAGLLSGTPLVIKAADGVYYLKLPAVRDSTDGDNATGANTPKRDD